jgi:hypothetical protein
MDETASPELKMRRPRSVLRREPNRRLIDARIPNSSARLGRRPRLVQDGAAVPTV